MLPTHRAPGLAGLLLALILAMLSGCTTIKVPDDSGASSNLIATTTTLAASATNVAVGTNFTLTATVSPSGATGTVTFHDGATVLGSGTVDSGIATFTTTSLAAGTHTITATYNGSSIYAPSTSAAIPVTVSAQPLTPTTITLAAATTSIYPGFYDLLTATVVSPSATGSVTFYDGNRPVSNETLNASGVALFGSGVFSTAGTYNLTASYGGSATYAPSTSNTVTVDVTSIPIIPTAVTVTLSAASVRFGDSVTVTVTVSPSDAIGGLVVFQDGKLLIGNEPGLVPLLSRRDQQRSMPLSLPPHPPTPAITINTTNNLLTIISFTEMLPVGTHTFSAQFAGSIAFEPSTSNPATLVVTP